MIECQNSRRTALKVSSKIVALSTEFNAGHIPKADHATGGVGAENDRAKFLLRSEAALSADSVGKLLASGSRLSPELTGGVDGILRAESGKNFGDGDVTLGKDGGVKSDAHGISRGQRR